MLDAPLSIEELKTALTKMKKLSAPGLDGLTVPFYQEFWLLLGQYIHANAVYAFKQKHFSVDQRRGLLKLIPKKIEIRGMLPILGLLLFLMLIIRW